ncbi:hypothetical protein HZA57_00900, partial [Candidatus Poribacteria bacterium]|nr:hypothetical protein [Candidatus Poribacteria bacterium]
EYLTIFILLVIGILIHAVGRFRRRKMTVKAREAIAEGDHAFNRFMAGVVAQDPDGAAWADWFNTYLHSAPASAPQDAPAQPTP